MKLILIEKRQETPTIYSFIFKAQEPFQFIAGQLLQIYVPHENPDSRGIRRAFSIASSPTEDFIMIATRIIENGSSFKKALMSLPPKTTIEAEGPYGIFNLPENDSTHCIFITGGVGITPVRGLLKYATDKRLPTPITLLYSNVTPEEIVYRELLDELESQNANLDIVYTITQPQDSKTAWSSQTQWSGKVGRIDKELIQEKIKDQNTRFYVSGPIALVENFYNLLKKLGIGDDSIKRENFPGY